MKKFFAAFSVLLLTGLATPAYAFHCPADMKKIDAALEKMHDIPADKLAKVKALRAKGEAEHKAGDHGASVKTLAEAMALLGMH